MSRTAPAARTSRALPDRAPGIRPGPAAAGATAYPRNALPARREATLPAWPVVGLLLLYPLWWALGLGVLIFPMLGLPMAALLWRARAAGRPILLPPGFGLWLLFLVTVVVSIGALGADPVGTVPEGAASRLLAVLFRLGNYLALSVLLIYVGNLREEELPRRRLVRLLGWLFVVTVAGGLLGVFAGTFEFTAPVEYLLPASARGNGFVESLVHPYAAQIMDVVGEASPRPAAPWGYTNTWGNNFCLLVVFFVASVWGGGRAARSGRVLALALLAIAVLPVVQSLNRGLWIGLVISAGYVGLRYGLAGRLWVLVGLATAGLTLAAALLLTPLGAQVEQRLETGKSDGVRSFLVNRAVTALPESPIIGFGSTRTTIGGRNSIAVGASAGCERCGNFTVGGNGQLWQLLFAHGVVGTAAYLGFFLYGLVRFRRDSTPIGIAASCAIFASFAAMLWYNALVTPLAFVLLAYALLWRNQLSASDVSAAKGTR